MDHHKSLALNLAWTANNAASFPQGHSPVDAIRRKCVDCCAGYLPAITDCTMHDCALWPYRMGKNPFHARSGKPNPDAFKKSK